MPRSVSFAGVAPVPPVWTVGAKDPSRKGRSSVEANGNSFWGGVRFVAVCSTMVAAAGGVAKAQLGSVVNWGEPDAIQGTPTGEFRQVWGGLGYSLGLRYNGAIVYWGPTPEYSEVPTAYFYELKEHVPPNNPSDPFVAIAAGRTHALALTASGHVVGWGDSNPTAQPATTAPAGVRFKAISAGENFSMGIVSSTDPTEDDRLRLWGWNYAFHRPDWNPPPLFSGKVRAISAGGHHGMVIKEDGTVHAWGPHGMHQHGQGNVPGYMENEPIAQIAAGHFHSLVLAMDGRVYGWGMNHNGQAESQPAADRFREIAAAHSTSLAVKHSGKVIVWGYNSYDIHTVPQVVPEPGMLIAGYYHAIALLGCYGDCDRNLQYDSNDLACFNYYFSNGHPWANCDGSTVAPILNIDDYTCFNARFAACQFR